ncbi:hypothetical protein tinsulaeT_30280 [Thalassotalea insulae]|uniref:TonB C-terminal domain-containing protein n=1 Tax=Thalassotalea insulae TaxID=2056778 RepID=A0ABQ6GUT5_9GAMM|nr:M56 family metallopeptidase [Thalassotalea insulae]GLX79688.1 hypothetical protein tinsulaeT_30280 [Thalassotalea insulae]
MSSVLVSLLYPLSISIVCLLILHRYMVDKLGTSYLYRLWGLVPLSLFAYLLPWPSTQPPKVLSSELSRFVVNPTQDLQRVFNNSELLVYLAMLVSAVMIGYWLITHLQFIRKLLLEPATKAQLAQLCFSHKPRKLAVYYSGSAYSPMLVGIFKQKLVLPENFHQAYNPEQQQLILQHEICHFDRNDIYWNLIAFSIVALFWFHPLVWLAYFRFRRDQELSCDFHVLARKQVSSRVNYSKALLVAAQTAPRFAFAQLSFKKYGDKAIMFERINQIKLNTKASGLSVSLASVLAIAMLSGFSYAGNLSSNESQPKYRTPPKAKEKISPIHRVEPKYPVKAAVEKIEGSVVLKYDVNIDGTVMNVEVMTGEPAYVFDRVAVTALKQWQYQPRASVAHNNLVQLDFRLDENSTFKDVNLIEKINVTK